MIYIVKKLHRNKMAIKVSKNKFKNPNYVGNVEVIRDDV